MTNVEKSAFRCADKSNSGIKKFGTVKNSD